MEVTATSTATCYSPPTIILTIRSEDSMLAHALALSLNEEEPAVRRSVSREELDRAVALSLAEAADTVVADSALAQTLAAET